MMSSPNDDNCRYVLLNLAHCDRRPRCDRAAFRVLGVFLSVDDAKTHATTRLLSTNSDASLHLLPLRKWTPIMRSENEEGNVALAHLENLGQRHRDRIREHTEEFEANVTNRRAGAVHHNNNITTKTEDQQQRSPQMIEEDGNKKTPVSAVPITAEVRMQRFAIVSVIQDEQETSNNSQQPAVLIWDVAETEQEAQDIIKERIARTVMDVHLDVVAMYEWLFPTEVDLSKVKEEYRDAKLDDLMRHRKDEHLRVTEFRKLCEERGQAVPLIDVSQPEIRVDVPVQNQPQLLEPSPPIQQTLEE